MQITANASHNRDVLVVLRGGGSTLGVVVEMTIKLVDVSDYYGVVVTTPDPSSSVLRCVTCII